MKYFAITIFIFMLTLPVFAENGYVVDIPEITAPEISEVQMPTITVPVEISSTYASPEEKTPMDFILGPVQVATAEVNTFSVGAVESVTQLKTTLDGMEVSASRYILVDLLLGGDENYYKTQMNSIQLTELDAYSGQRIKKDIDSLIPLTRSGYEVKDVSVLLKDLKSTLSYIGNTSIDDKKTAAQRSAVFIIRDLLPHAMNAYKGKGWKIKKSEIIDQLKPYITSRIRKGYKGEGSKYHRDMYSQVKIYIEKAFSYMDEGKYTDREIISKVTEYAQKQVYNLVTRESIKYQGFKNINQHIQRTVNLMHSSEIMSEENVLKEFPKGLNQSIQMNMNSDKLKSYLVGNWRYRVIKKALELYHSGMMVTNIDKFSKKNINNKWVIYYKDRPATGYEAVLHNPF